MEYSGRIDLISPLNPSDRVRWVEARSKQIARSVDRPRVEVEHLAAALCESVGVGAHALHRLGVKPMLLRKHLSSRFHLPPRPGRAAVLSRLFGARSPTKDDSLSGSDSVTQIYCNAAAEARELRHCYVGTEHLLLALLRNRGDVADLFERAGARYEAVRAEVGSLLGNPGKAR
jgi:ATP-dependent Clp protease ATP-binding subunit ClpA